MSSAPFGNESSVKALEWLAQYKKLSGKTAGTLTESEKKTLEYLESKLTSILNQKKGTRRTNLRVETNFKINYGRSKDFQKAYIRNISGGGLFIATENLSPIGTEIQMELHFEDIKEKLEIKGTVAWLNPEKQKSTPMGFGVKFLNLDEKSSLLIKKIMATELEKNFKK